MQKKNLTLPYNQEDRSDLAIPVTVLVETENGDRGVILLRGNLSVNASIDVSNQKRHCPGKKISRWQCLFCILFSEGIYYACFRLKIKFSCFSVVLSADRKEQPVFIGTGTEIECTYPIGLK